MLRIRRVTIADIPAVEQVERAAFGAGWPAAAFERELTANTMARYLLLERVEAERGPAALIGFGGLWLMVDQAHIVTVAVDPQEQRQGYGSLLVHALVVLARESGMDEATLEVRESNGAARGLYRGYGFHEVGARKRYYSDNGEDAVIMTTESLRSAGYQQKLDRNRERLAAAFGVGLGSSLDSESYGFAG
ncbi:MAG: ribosomal protein S18-alanine N-acetyltransferase [Dehalococcoidia bacterium]